MDDKIQGFAAPSPSSTPLSAVFLLFRESPEVATNTMVKYTKRLFLEITGTPVARKVSEDVLAHPTWVEQSSVCFCLKKVTDDEAAAMVQRALQRVGSAVLAEASGMAVMIGALQVRIHAMQDGFFNFSFKQAFTRGIPNAE